jgi:nucleotide-binding universal stress UspA family protein
VFISQDTKEAMMSGSYNTILVPLDGSEVANQALPHARQLAAKFDAELVLFRVVPDVKASVTLKEYLPALDLNLEHQQSLVDHAARWLQRLADEMALHHIRARPVVNVGEADDCILNYAVSDGVDLIVMSTHGHTGVARWMYGSVAAKVLTSVSCPVMLVHSQLPGAAGEYERRESVSAA